MSKIKNLSDLDSLYNMVQENAANMPAIVSGNKQPDILLTDATNYLPKVGEGFGKKEEKLAKDTGPDAAGGYKKEAKEKQEAAEETKQEEGDMEAAEKNEDAPEKEKVEETVDSSSRTPKYNKQHFTMPKSKFQKLYEDAVNGVPFQNVSEEEHIAPVEPAADHEEPAMGGPEGDEGEEACCTHEEAIEMVEKLMKFLQKDKAYDQEHGDLGDEDKAFTQGEEEPGNAMGEAVEAEDLGHANVGSGVKTEMGKDGHKIQKVGNLKPKGAASEQGGPKGQDGAASKLKDFDKALQNVKGSREVGNLKTDKGTSNAFEQ